MRKVESQEVEAQRPITPPSIARGQRVAAKSDTPGNMWTAPVCCALVSLALAWLTVRGADMALPWDQSADNLHMAAIAKTLSDYAWLWSNPQLGLPGTLDFRLWPMSDSAHLLGIKALAGLGMAPFTALNVYFMLGFALVGAAATWVLQRTGLSAAAALLGGVLYALLPYHGWRGIMHLLLGAYYTVPIFVFLLLQCLDMIDERHTWRMRTTLVVTFLLPSFGGYYAFFFCYLLGFAIVFQGAIQRSWQPLVRGATLIACTGAGMLSNVLPSLWFKMHNADPGKMVRPLQDTEIYALKFVQMFLPLLNHRTAWMRNMALHYDRQAPMVNENQSASLGLAMTAIFTGVLVVTTIALWNDFRDGNPAWSRIRKVGIISGWAFLFATVGGAGSIMGFYITPFIRSANRMSVFISFFALIIASWAWQAWGSKWIRTDGHKAMACVAGVFLVALAAWDSADTDYFPRRAESAAMFNQDAAFFSQLQNKVGQDARIFQVPFVRYPEGGLGTQDYYHFRPLPPYGWIALVFRRPHRQPG